MNFKPVLKLDWATHAAAKLACENWHYSKCMPVNKTVKIGAWENEKYIGCVIFSPGASPDLYKSYKITQQQGCELTRIALTKHISPVSKILSLAIKFLKKSNPNIELIVSFADTTQGHHGGIYQATNWIYSGTTSARKVPIVRGKQIHERSLSVMVKQGKIKRSDCKWENIPGKHRYLMPLTDDMREKVAKLSKPYPKRASSIESGTSGFQSEGGGESPTDALQS